MVEGKKVGNGKIEKKTEEKKAETKKTSETVEKILEIVEKKLEEALKTIDVETVEKMVREFEETEKRIRELEDKKMEILDFLITAMETVDINLFKTLKSLGINGVTDIILRAYEITAKAKATVEERHENTKISRSRRGEGIGNRKINFKGRVYNIPQYFMKKMGVSGGLEGLKKWAEENGYKITITDEMIIIE